MWATMAFNDNYKTVFVECDCTTHAISVSRWVDPPESKFYDPNVYLSVWGHAEMNHDRWRDRLRIAWHALTGNLHVDSVVLSPEEAAMFAYAVAKMANEGITDA